MRRSLEIGIDQLIGQFDRRVIPLSSLLEKMEEELPVGSTLSEREIARVWPQDASTCKVKG